MTVREYLSRRPEKNYAILRHDVDTKPHRALSMARLEHSMGISSTYYFRHTREVFKPQIIREVADLGHEIGYHYEVLSTAKGDYSQAIVLFIQELADFQEITPVSTICMHGSPLSPYDNRDLWQNYDSRIMGSSGKPTFRWMLICTIVRIPGGDGTKSTKSETTCRETKILMQRQQMMSSRLSGIAVPSLYLLVHPGNWAPSRSEWIAAWGMNIAGNAVKSMVMWRRSL